MARLPIRLRLMLAVTGAVALVLAGGGFLLYHHLATSLDSTLDQGLRTRSRDVAALVSQADPGLREAPPAPVADTAGSFAQVLDARGRVHDETRGLGGRPLLAGALLQRARAGPLLITRVHLLGADVRLLAVPVATQGRHVVLVVGAPLASRDRALSSLRSELLVGGPFALLLAALIGYLVAGAALAPVERMRARAASITERRLSERLPVPRARDEIARLGTTLNEMLDRLEAGLRRERSFVADASHELRTPLSLVRTEVELALDMPRGIPELQAALRSIGEEADRLSQLADDLLLLARLDEGQIPLRVEPVHAEALLGDLAERFRRRAADDGRRIAVQATEIVMRCDRIRVEQALANLVENALRHGSGTVTLSAALHGGEVEVHVVDEGPGFADGIVDTALERFTRGDAARRAGGAGLGLAIVKAIIEAHGGTVALAHDEGGGADVVLLLPHARPVAPNARDAAPAGAVAG